MATRNESESPIIQGILFDFDGTLAEMKIDFPSLYARIFDLAREFGYEPNNLTERYLIEITEEISSRIGGKKGRDFHDAALGIVVLTEMESASNASLFPHARTFLKTLRDRGIKVAIVTRNTKDAVLTVFPQVESELDAFFPRESVAHIKPHPEHLAMAVSRLGTPPGQTAMVGDHPIDIISAKNAHLIPIGVLSGNSSRDALIDAGASFIFDQAHHIAEHLHKNGSHWTLMTKNDHQKLPTGKLSYDLLTDILRKFKASDPRIILGPRVGEDAAVIDMGDSYLVATTDPITFTSDNIGYYAININANDIAVHGAIPKWFMVTILLPLGESDEETVRNIFEQIDEAMAPLGINLIGGHTEVSDSVTRPVVIGTMLGEVTKNRLITTAGAKAGDIVFLTKGIPIEGTVIIASEKDEDLRQKNVPESVIASARSLLYSPGISVVKDAKCAHNAAPISSMHDPTEGGLAAGLNEIAIAANVSIVIRDNDIPILPEAKLFCSIYGIDPIATISSGALLFTSNPRYRENIIEAFQLQDILVVDIGYIDEPSGERVSMIKKDGTTVPLPYRERDEILKLF